MASAIAQGFHLQKMTQEKERTLLRIEYGTKASNPQALNERRMNPLNYSNPLPDNSSGSKIRMFFGAKDESGRPNAMEKVAMRQRGELTGGVLTDYRYARKILDQRERDVRNQELEAQGLPAEPAPILQLDEVESRIMELSTLLSGINDAIDDGDITQLTVNELKNIPRLLVAIAPSLTEKQIVDMIDYIGDIVLSLNSAETISAPVRRVASRIKSFFVSRVVEFLKALLEIVNIAPADKLNAIREFAKTFFNVRPERQPVQTDIDVIPEEQDAEMLEEPEEPEEPETPPSRGTTEPEEAPAPESARRPRVATEEVFNADQFTSQKAEAVEELVAVPVRDLNKDVISLLYNRLPGSQQERMTGATPATLRKRLVSRIKAIPPNPAGSKKLNKWYREVYQPNINRLTN